MELTDRRGASAALDYSASAEGRTAMLDRLGTMRRACYIGETGQVNMDPSHRIFGRQLTITGFRVFGIPELMDMTRLMKQKNVPIEKLATHRFPITQFKEAVETFRGSNTGKVCFVWG